ncbi:MAG TPA: hypothetical protein VM617_05945, partial [Thermoanaerobaculia bacterium]|nr:hypothetical protein [Thermoanaerobaculia bacterium]
MGVASLLLVLALAGLLGAAVLAAADRSSSRSVDPALALVAGLVCLHGLLLLFDLAAVPWRRAPLAAGWVVATGLASWLAWRRRGPGGRSSAATLEGWNRPGPGDAVAAVALVAYAGASWTRLITIPDFVYHWGIKAKRHLLAGGIDYAFLADPLRLTDHPDYPSLVPGLYAAVGVVRGAFHERAALLASVAFFALAVAATRRTVRVARLSPAAAQGTVALVALVLAMFGIGHRMAGAADWPIVAALLVALPGMLAAPGGGAEAGGDGAMRLGFAAALAAGAKIEGV